MLLSGGRPNGWPQSPDGSQGGTRVGVGERVFVRNKIIVCGEYQERHSVLFLLKTQRSAPSSLGGDCAVVLVVASTC